MPYSNNFKKQSAPAASPKALFGAALVILSVFKAVLLCHGPMLLSVLCMIFAVRKESLRRFSPIIAIVGSAACPLACAELCALLLGTGPIWELFQETGNALARLNYFENEKESHKDPKNNKKKKN